MSEGAAGTTLELNLGPGENEYAKFVWCCSSVACKQLVYRLVLLK